MKSDRDFKYQLISFLQNQAHWIITVSAVTILCLTLLPFEFAIPQGLSLGYVFNEFFQATSLNDLIVNIFLFAPLGFGLAAFFYKRNKSQSPLIITVFLLSLCLSLSVEICQLFLTSRNAAFTDLLTNSLGGGLGGISFLTLLKLNLQKIQKFFAFLKVNNPLIRLKSLTILWLAYFFLMAFLLIKIQDSTQLSNWNNKFPLLIGNEATGDRYWSGQISYLCISEKSFSKEQIERLFKTNNSCIKSAQDSASFITAYSFVDSQKSYPELTQNLPTLDNQGITTPPIKNTGILVGKKNWLRTKIPAIELTRKLRDSSQFTLFTKVATKNFKQEGPARIISLSRDHLVRNLTIAQWHKDLALRIRMPLTGINGKNPEIRIKNFFNDPKSHQLAIAYDGLRLRTYVDRIENARNLYLGSEAALFWSVFSIIAEKMYLNVANDPFYHLLYYGFIFAPLGIGLGLISTLLRISLGGWLTLIIGGLIIPPLLIETIIINYSDRLWDWNYLSLGISILTISFLLTKMINDKSS